MNKKETFVRYVRDVLPVIAGGLVLFFLLVAGLLRIGAKGNITRGLSTEKETIEEELAGPAGIVDAVRDMKEYDQKGRMIRVNAPGETVLAGIDRVNRNMTILNQFGRLAGRADELGYEARRVVTDNQLPYQEYYTLLQIVEAEATGGDVKSKLLIADVVLNRVADERFPDTITEVVWQNVDGYPQFSPTADGRMGNLTITESTIQAVRRALDGENIAEGALFFVAPSSANDTSMKWFDDSLVYLYEYGGHAYYRFPYEGETGARNTKRSEASSEELPEEETENA